jgi:alanine dehydrogenase
MVLVITRKDLERVLTMKENIAILEEAFKEHSTGNVKMPVRPTITIEDVGGTMAYMPAYVGGKINALGVKVVSIFRDNPTKYNLPLILGTVLLNDTKTGAPLAIIDGGYLTAMRTGATSGVATKHMARKDAKTVGVFGAGVQAETQVLAVAEVREIANVKVFDVIKPNAEKYCAKMQKALKAKVTVANSAKEAVEGSDIIVTATTSKQPVFQGEWLSSGTHINGIGSHFGAGIKEVDGTAVKRARVVVDSREACLKEAGDIIDPIKDGLISENHIYAELGEVVAGKKKGRLNDDEITFFKSVGLALEDVSTALRVFELAKQHNLGTSVTI